MGDASQKVLPDFAPAAVDLLTVLIIALVAASGGLVFGYDIGITGGRWVGGYVVPLMQWLHARMDVSVGRECEWSDTSSSLRQGSSIVVICLIDGFSSHFADVSVSCMLAPCCSDAELHLLCRHVVTFSGCGGGHICDLYLGLMPDAFCD